MAPTESSAHTASVAPRTVTDTKSLCHHPPRGSRSAITARGPGDPDLTAKLTAEQTQRTQRTQRTPMEDPDWTTDQEVGGSSPSERTLVEAGQSPAAPIQGSGLCRFPGQVLQFVLQQVTIKARDADSGERCRTWPPADSHGSHLVPTHRLRAAAISRIAIGRPRSMPLWRAWATFGAGPGAPSARPPRRMWLTS